MSPEPVHVLEKGERVVQPGQEWVRGEVYIPLTPAFPLGAQLACGWGPGRAGLSRPAWRWGRVSRELLLPPAAALRGCSAAASRAGAAAGASGTEPSPQVHGCGDSSGMTGHHGWGYGQNDGRRRPRPAPIR